MSEVEDLLKAYESIVRLPWDPSLSGQERVWFVVYDPAQERRIRLRLGEFENITKKAGHTWHSLNLTDSFAQWMSQHKYRQAYFEEPEKLSPALKAFTTSVAAQINEALTATNVDENTVVAISGLASLFGLTRVSVILEKVMTDLRGRLLVFFPGQHDGSNYRLLDARDGWNYLAVPITAKKWGVD
ncbi:MAG TPA: BREX protein BrxB domain-containing protein [Anaerolineaceae bacterium]|nr:BREX protein BrxB domain-containing protein [Anaerolineaceae bacterium]